VQSLVLTERDTHCHSEHLHSSILESGSCASNGAWRIEFGDSANRNDISQKDIEGYLKRKVKRAFECDEQAGVNHA